MRNLLLFLFCFLNMLGAYAQGYEVYGKIQGAADKTPLIGATVVITNRVDDVTITGSTTDVEGKFRIEKVAPGKYTLKVQYLGYSTFRKPIEIENASVNVGNLELIEEATRLGEVQIIGKIPPGEQKGDTTQFNAEAFKTAPDATAQDLVQKMPGITMQDGVIQAQGENVQQILIDGKPFFGTDVNTALQNLPSSVIANIQVFDKKSDKAELSGFDDGERIKTINIITKPSRKIGRFGRTSVGYGSDNRFQAGASVNFFSDERRITVTGLSNNINTLNFTADPNSGGGERPQNGIITTNGFGLNYSETFGKKMEVSGSYFYNNRRSNTTQQRFRDFVLPTDSGQVYTEENRNTNTDANHNLRMRIDYNINDRNRIRFRPSISLQNFNSNTYFLGRTQNDFNPLNQSTNNASGDNVNSDISNNFLYSHRFLKPGRSITFNLRTGYHRDNGNSYRLAENIFYSRFSDSTQILNQYTNLDRKGFDWEGEVSYTEPLSKNSQLEFEYEVGNRLNDSDKRTYDYIELTDDYTALNIPLSNTFTNNYITQEAEAGYRFNSEKLKLQLDASYQQATLKNQQVFPMGADLNRNFHSILPAARLEYKFSEASNLEFNYRASTTAPSVGQLQDVIDYSNPLQIRVGNPNLNQSYQNWTRLQYRSHNANTNRTFYSSVWGTFIKNFITNSTQIATDPIVLNEEVTAGRGAQVIKPVNLNGYWDVRSYFSYGQPVNFISSNINLNGGLSHTSRPGLINNEVNVANSSGFRVGVSLSSNISERVDFTISTRSNYNIVKNTLRPALNNNYFSQTTRLRYNWIFWKGFVYRTDLHHQAYSGLSDLSNNFLLWNMSLGKKIFRNQRGEINLNVYDLLKQNNSIWRNVSDAYVEDIQTNVLQRYFMLSFTYNIRYFGVGTSMKDFEGTKRD